jgi:hypothetical protein
MKLRLAVAIIFATALTAGAVFAQSVPTELAAAYKAGVAAEKCDLGLDSAKSSQLGDAVQRIEQKSGLGQGDLDALYTQTQADADADNAGFCGPAAAMVDEVIASAN